MSMTRYVAPWYAPSAAMQCMKRTRCGMSESPFRVASVLAPPYLAACNPLDDSSLHAPSEQCPGGPWIAWWPQHGSVGKKSAKCWLQRYPRPRLLGRTVRPLRFAAQPRLVDTSTSSSLFTPRALRGTLPVALPPHMPVTFRRYSGYDSRDAHGTRQRLAERPWKDTLPSSIGRASTAANILRRRSCV